MRTSVYVVEVLDGDTFRTARNEYVRLANVYAPEKRQFGYEGAKAALKSLVLWKIVDIEVVAKDIYGRFVGDVWEGAVSVNQIMRRLGYN